MLSAELEIPQPQQQLSMSLDAQRIVEPRTFLELLLPFLARRHKLFPGSRDETMCMAERQLRPAES